MQCEWQLTPLTVQVKSVLNTGQWVYPSVGSQDKRFCPRRNMSLFLSSVAKKRPYIWGRSDCSKSTPGRAALPFTHIFLSSWCCYDLGQWSQFGLGRVSGGSVGSSRLYQEWQATYGAVGHRRLDPALCHIPAHQPFKGSSEQCSYFTCSQHKPTLTPINIP